MGPLLKLECYYSNWSCLCLWLVFDDSSINFSIMCSLSVHLCSNKSTLMHTMLLPTPLHIPWYWYDHAYCAYVIPWQLVKNGGSVHTKHRCLLLFNNMVICAAAKRKRKSPKQELESTTGSWWVQSPKVTMEEYHDHHIMRFPPPPLPQNNILPHLLCLLLCYYDQVN